MECGKPVASPETQSEAMKPGLENNAAGQHYS
jgi:hypothetical protein